MIHSAQFVAVALALALSGNLALSQTSSGSGRPADKPAPSKAVIVLTALFPRNDNTAVIPTINRINDNLANMADGKKIRYPR